MILKGDLILLHIKCCYLGSSGSSFVYKCYNN